MSSFLREEISKINFIVATNSQLINLNLNASLSSSNDDSENISKVFNRSPDYFLGLELKIPFDRKPQKKIFMDARIALELASIEKKEIQENLFIQTKQLLNTISTLIEQVKIAQEAQDLAKEQLEVENLKLKQGISSISEINDKEEELIDAENSVLSAKISYVNALADLDQLTGNTLKKWKINFQEK